MTQPQDKMRAEFEAFYMSVLRQELPGLVAASDERLSRDYLGVGPDGIYLAMRAQEEWRAWQAACAQQYAQSQQDALDAARARWVLKNATYVTGEFTDQLGIVQSFYWDAELGENIAEEIDLAIAAQGASNV